VQVVDDQDARSARGKEPVDVAGRDLDERRDDLGGIGRDVLELGLPAGERGIARNGRDGPAEAARGSGVELAIEQQPSWANSRA
jgi:hypothetical protein